MSFQQPPSFVFVAVRTRRHLSPFPRNDPTISWCPRDSIVGVSAFRKALFQQPSAISIDYYVDECGPISKMIPRRSITASCRSDPNLRCPCDSTFVVPGRIFPATSPVIWRLTVIPDVTICRVTGIPVRPHLTPGLVCRCTGSRGSRFSA